MPDFVLATLNARFAHASMGLRCLRANLGALRDRSEIREFVIGQKTEEIVERLLAGSPKVIGLGVYIWNVVETTQVVAMLKTLAPDVILVLGGPEVSYESTEQRICTLADYVITGWGDVSLRELLLAIDRHEPPPHKLIAGIQPPLQELVMPYAEYSDDDITRRHIYVEASRGCPFKCEFCLSALDKTAWPFPLDPFIAELESLHARGLRVFKFVDRTFNLKIDTSIRILDFFLDKLAAFPDDPVFAHFELIPDHLPDKLKDKILAFPAGTLQFEIGIQTFDPDVQTRISRRQDNTKAESNIRWLRTQSTAHLHVDLIAGLPGEDIATFGRGFDRLVAMNPHEIQFGILKRLRGTPIIRHTGPFDLRFNPDPPYNILATNVIEFSEMQRLNRFARYWDIVANSGRYTRTLVVLLGETPFVSFLAFSDWLYARTGQTHAIAHERMVHLIHEWLVNARPLQRTEFEDTLLSDYRAAGGRTRLAFESEDSILPPPRPAKRAGATPSRQARHLPDSSAG